MSYPTDVRYTRDHEWIRLEGEIGRIGVTHYAQEQLGDVVFVELPEVGRALAKGDQFGSIESVNQDPHATWMIAITIDAAGEVEDLLDADGYASLIGGA